MSTIQDRQYQDDAKDAAWREFDRGTRSTLVTMPTGTGKTVVAAKCAAVAKERGLKTLFLAHREVLVSQAFDTLSRFGLDAAIEMGSFDARRGSLFSNPEVTVGTVQTLQGDRLDSWPSDAFGHIITDECHRAASDSHQAVYRHFPGAYHLGITATPDGASGKIGNVYKSLAYHYTMVQAVKDGWLVKPIREQCEISVDLRNIRTTSGDYLASELADRIRPAIEYIADAIKQRVGDRYFVAFTPDVGCAQALAKAIRGDSPSGAGIDCRYVAGSGGRFGMNPKERREILSQYDDRKFQGLVCCDLLFEGWDARHCSDVVIARPTKLRYRYAQMVGRGTRICPEIGKEQCTIIDFDWKTDGTSRDLVSPVELFSMDDPELEKMDLQSRERIIDDAKKIMKRGEKDPALAIEEAKELNRPRKELPIFLTGTKAEFSVKITDPLGVAGLLGVKLKKRYDFAKPGYEPAKPWQIEKLKKEGVFNGASLSFFGAQKMLRAIEKRKKDGLADHQEVARLLEIGTGEITSRAMTKGQASKILGHYNPGTSEKG